MHWERLGQHRKPEWPFAGTEQWKGVRKAAADVVGATIVVGCRCIVVVSFPCGLSCPPQCPATNEATRETGEGGRERGGKVVSGARRGQ